jgi:hypothetical protein
VITLHTRPTHVPHTTPPSRLAAPQVHQAVWKSTTCAVKTLFVNDRMTEADKAKMREGFLREAALLCQLRHPNIVNVLAVSVSELTLVMVRARGGACAR